MASTVTVEFLVDFLLDYGLKITSTDVLTRFDWVVLRSGPDEVTVGTPTGIVGETTAINFKQAWDIDNPTYTSVVTANSITITSAVADETWTGVQAADLSTPEGEVLVLGVDYNVTFDNEQPVIDTSNIGLSLVRSPHYINIPFNFTTTTAATAQIFIWNGDLTMIPTIPTYDETLTRPSIDFSEFNVSVSNFAKSELKPKPIIDITSSPQIVNSSSEAVKWVRYIVSYADTQEIIPDIEFQLSAVEGYGNYSEGVNPTKPSNNWLSECFNRRVSRNGIILLPFLNTSEITSITVVSNGGEINTTLPITSSNESTEFVQYVQVDVSDTSKDSYITISDGTTSFIFEIIDECRFEPKQVIFKNRFGAFEPITLFKKNTSSISVDKSQFVNNYLSNGVYDTSVHQIKDINITAKESIRLNSGYINESENELYKQMIVSDQVWFYESELIPIRPMKNTLEFKTRVNDGLVNYELDFEYAYNYIQNV